MFSGFLIIFFLPVSLSLSAESSLIPARNIYDDFLDVLKTSDNCTNFYYISILGLNSLNRTSYIERIQIDLFKRYIEMRKDGIPDEEIEELLNTYCEAKSYVPLALYSWKPPLNLKGNFTWNLTNSSSENDDYHLAKKKEEDLVDLFELKKMLVTSEYESENKKSASKDRDNLKLLFRVSAFIIIFNLALSIQNLLRMYYEVEEEGEEFELPERFGYLGETIQIILFVLILIIILNILYNDDFE
ncbi:unnamed protein product [Caenorhabditis brenneri]